MHRPETLVGAQGIAPLPGFSEMSISYGLMHSLDLTMWRIVTVVIVHHFCTFKFDKS